MVQVSFGKDRSRLGFSCKGHAGFAKRGEPDVVCAAVSALSVTLCNALANTSGFCCRIESGSVNLCCNRTAQAETVFHAILVGFHGLSEQYPNHVSIDTQAAQTAEREKT